MGQAFLAFFISPYYRIYSVPFLPIPSFLFSLILLLPLIKLTVHFHPQALLSPTSKSDLESSEWWTSDEAPAVVDQNTAVSPGTKQG